jgi:acyl transferase domain-containing protein
MTKPADDSAQTLREALRTVRRLRAEIADLRAGRHEPIAIVGLGCRFPGADDADSFWRMLREGRCAISDVPEARWSRPAFFDPDPAAPGKMYSTRGGFVDGAGSFDAAFFGISAAEAARIDPQQRLLLEVCWQALEHAGLAPDRLEGSRTGVFVGMSSDDFGNALRMVAGGFEAIDPMVSLGTARSIAAGRIAYALKLNGPVLQLDTSCSSSLLAVHLACQSLRAGECDVALAGGVNLMLSPETTIGFSKLRALSSSGVCSAFDRDADGYVRGEGCGVVVLRRSSDVRDGERALARIRGGSVNHDGRSNGMTAPNARAQQGVVEDALARAGVSAEDVDYVEAHGTGTPLGDPIEAAALARALRRDGHGRPPLWIGSVKPTIGHLEASAGVASLIKLVLALRHGTIPASLHFANPSPNVAWDATAVRVAATEQPWPDRSPLRIAGVSAFGMSGTNVHLVLDADARPEAPPGREPRIDVLTLSARDPAALRAAAARTARWIAENPGVPLRDVCHTASAGRAALRHRAAIPAASPLALGELLARVASGEPPPSVRRSPAGGTSPRRAIAFVFDGETAGAPGIERALPERIPPLRAALAALARPVRDALGVELDRLLCGGGAVPLDDPRTAQVAHVAFQIALARMWTALGADPVLLVASGAGELAAACVAGALADDAAIALAAERGDCLAGLAPEGSLVRVALPADRAEGIAKELGIPAELAGIEGDRRALLGVGPKALPDLAAHLSERGVAWRRLAVRRPLHTSWMREAAASFASHVRDAEWREPAVPILAASAIPDPRTALSQGLASALLFPQTLRAAAERGTDLLLSLGPRRPSWRRSAGDEEAIPRVVTAGRARCDARSVADALARAWCSGVAIDGSAVSAGSGRIVDLPGYPFQRTEYPLPGPALSARARDRAAADGAVLAMQTDSTPRPDLPVPFAAPAGDLERKLAGFWEQALGITGIGRDDDFFDLGGDSLVATRITNLVRQHLGFTITPAEFLDSGCVRELAHRIETGGGGGPADPEIEALLAEVEGLSEAEIESLLAERGDAAAAPAGAEVE